MGINNKDLYSNNIYIVNDKNNQDTLSSIKKTVLGRFYLNRVKKISIVRTGILFIWTFLLPKYLEIKLFVYGFSSERRSKLILFDQLFADIACNNKNLIFGRSIVSTPVPVLFPTIKRKNLVSPHDQYEFCNISVLKVERAQIHGGTNLVTKDDATIAHDLFEFNNDYTSEELHVRLVVNPKKNTVIWFCFDDDPEEIDVAASFVDACASNYAHWLTEVLPRIVIFCQQTKLTHVPLVINAGLHKNLMESLLLLTGGERKIVLLPTGRSINVECLYVMSATGYVPFDRRKKKASISHGKFSPDALRIVRQLAIDRISNKKCYDKIYLKRNASIRNVTNTEEIELFLISCGFSIVEPEKLTFSEQVSIFSEAEIIVGATGAAFANIIFCKENTQIIIFLPDVPNTSYWYWQNIACSTGNKVTYVVGKVLNSKGGIHSSYSISITDLSDALL